MYDRVKAELASDRFYRDNFPNFGQSFVAWYLHRVLLLDVHETRAAITDGQMDKQIDAIVVDDAERRVRIVQGKFVQPASMDATSLREVLSAWTRLKDLPTLQLECSGRLAERLEAARVALEDGYELQFELLTTGVLTQAAVSDLGAFEREMSESEELPASLLLLDEDVLEARLADAENRDLPELEATVSFDRERCLITEESGVRVVLAILPLRECVKLPGIADGKLFRRNVRMSLGLSNKVNKALRQTIVNPERSPYFFFFHNGVTAICRKFVLEGDKLKISGLSVVNGCQSLSTIYATSGKVTSADSAGSILFRFYEIPQQDLGDAISVNTNSQSAVKPRDLRSNDVYLREIKRRYESEIVGSYFLTRRGEDRPADKDPDRCIDSPDYGRMVVAWQCQRPGLATNEKRLFDELYKTLFHPKLDAQSILALRLWLNQIDVHWAHLDINEAVKAVRGAARFHMLFLISQLFAHGSGQSDKVPEPSATVSALPHAGMVLTQAKECLNQALTQAVAQSTAAGKVFSAQNWLKSKTAVADEQLVARTIVNVLKGLQNPALQPFMSALTLPPDKFHLRWSAD